MQARGDIEVDAHHTVEDTAIALGQALREALGDKLGICRFGDALVPLDETLVRAAVDLSGRPYVVHTEPDGMSPLIGTYDTTLTRHFFESLAQSAGICVHLDVLRGRNPHHIVEAQFKAFAPGAAHGGRAGSARGRRGAEHQGRPLDGRGPARLMRSAPAHAVRGRTSESRKPGTSLSLGPVSVCNAKAVGLRTGIVVSGMLRDKAIDQAMR